MMYSIPAVLMVPGHRIELAFLDSLDIGKSCLVLTDEPRSTLTETRSCVMRQLYLRRGNDS